MKSDTQDVAANFDSKETLSEGLEKDIIGQENSQTRCLVTSLAANLAPKRLDRRGIGVASNSIFLNTAKSFGFDPVTLLTVSLSN